MQILILQHQYDVKQQYHEEKKADYIFQYMMYNITASMGWLIMDNPFSLLPQMFQVYPIKIELRKDISEGEGKTGTNFFQIFYKFPIEVDDNDEEDEFELQNDGHDNVRDSDFDYDDEANKILETNSFGTKVGEYIEVNVVGEENEANPVSIEIEARENVFVQPVLRQ